MDEPKALQSLGLVLPTPAYIAGAILFGIVGYVAYKRGRKATRPVLTWTGVILMLYPYAVPQIWQLWTIGLGLCGWVYVKWDEASQGFDQPPDSTIFGSRRSCRSLELAGDEDSLYAAASQ